MLIRNTKAFAAAAQMDAAIDLPTFFSPDACLQKGLVQVAKTASAPHSIYYELHGCPSSQVKERIVFVPGLNVACASWKVALEYFAAIPGYQVCVLDNRGVGNSQTPSSSRLWKTSQMAGDVLELLDYLHWNTPRCCCIVGVSMGGMIAQECAIADPERFVAVCLVSSKSGAKWDAPPLAGIKMFARMSLGLVSSEKEAMELVATTLYPTRFLESRDGQGRRQQDIIVEQLLERLRLGKRQTTAGRLGQMHAAVTHKMSKESALRVAESIPAILVITGDEDQIIVPEQSKILHEMLPGSEYFVVPGVGHALPAQVPTLFHEHVLKLIERGRAASQPHA